jgi:hypothetical protein
MRRSVYIFYSFGGIPSIKRLKLLIKKRKQTNKEGKKTVRCNALAGCQISKYGCSLNHSARFSGFSHP